MGLSSAADRRISQAVKRRLREHGSGVGGGGGAESKGMRRLIC